MKSTKRRMLLAFLTVMALMLFITLFFIYSDYRITKEYQKITDNILAEYRVIDASTSIVRNYYSLIKNMNNEDKMRIYEDSKKEIRDVFSFLDLRITNEESEVAYKGLKNTVEGLLSLCDNSIRNAREGNIVKMSEDYAEAHKKNSFVQQNTATLVLKELGYTEELNRRLESTRRTTMISGIALLALIITCCVFFSLVFSNRLISPILELSKTVKNIEIYNPDSQISETLLRRDDEAGELSNSFSTLISTLREQMSALKISNEELTKAKGEITNKIGEMTNTKTAILNMMEDMDDTNKSLVVTKEQLRESLEELKKLDVKKDEFISIAAHELKTPLTSIHGFSQLLQTEKVAGDSEQRKKFLKIMDNETKRLANLVNDILDLSRIDLGTIKLNLDKVDMNEIVDSVAREMSIAVKTKGLNFETDIDKGLPTITTDRERATQVMINIIGNAIKYTLQGKIMFIVKKEEENIHFIIKDTGIGIPNDYHQKIFERFYQIDSSYTRKAGGTGLGLSLCKEFLNLLNGRIWVESEEGKGSEFHFTLPINNAPDEKKGKKK